MIFRCTVKDCGIYQVAPKYEIKDGVLVAIYVPNAPLDKIPWGVCPLHADTKLHVDAVEKKADAAIKAALDSIDPDGRR